MIACAEAARLTSSRTPNARPVSIDANGAVGVCATTGKASTGRIFRKAGGQAVLPIVVPVPTVGAVGLVHRRRGHRERGNSGARRSDRGRHREFEGLHFWFLLCTQRLPVSEGVLPVCKRSCRYCL